MVYGDSPAALEDAQLAGLAIALLVGRAPPYYTLHLADKRSRFVACTCRYRIVH